MEVTQFTQFTQMEVTQTSHTIHTIHTIPVSFPQIVSSIPPIVSSDKTKQPKTLPVDSKEQQQQFHTHIARVWLMERGLQPHFDLFIVIETSSHNPLIAFLSRFHLSPKSPLEFQEQHNQHRNHNEIACRILLSHHPGHDHGPVHHERREKYAAQIAGKWSE